MYLKSYIEVSQNRCNIFNGALKSCLYQGAVDFIFGQKGQAFFQGNTIASKGAGCVTASGRSSNDSTMCSVFSMHSETATDKSIYRTDVFDQNVLIAASDAFSNVTDKTFLGRPWMGMCSVIICRLR